MTDEQIEKLLYTLEAQSTIRCLTSDGRVWDEGMKIARHIADGGDVKVEWSKKHPGTQEVTLLDKSESG